MKILQLIPAFYPAFAYGGTVNVAYNISRELVKRGHDVTVYTSDTIDETTRQTTRYLEHEGIKIHYYRNISNHLAWKRYVLYPGLVGALRANLQDFDVVHLHGIRNFQNIVAAYYANKFQVPYVIQAHGSLPADTKETIKKVYDRIWGQNILQRSSKVLALTQIEAAQYRSLGVSESKITIIPNGIDLSQFSSLPGKGTFRKKHGISVDDKVLLFLGRINVIKGIDLLIDAYCQLLNEIPNLRLVITGPDDDYLSAVEAKLDKLRPPVAPIITGPLYGQDKLEAYVDANVYVLPSYYETFPMTVLEAWSCGTPVIVTEGCQIADIVNDGGLISRFDPIDLKDKIIAILSNNTLRNELGSAGKNLVNDQYDLSSIIKKYEQVYSELTSRCDRIER